MLPIRVHPDVYAELQSSRRWYETKAEGLGNEFLDEIELAMDAVQRSPRNMVIL